MEEFTDHCIYHIRSYISYHIISYNIIYIISQSKTSHLIGWDVSGRLRWDIVASQMASLIRMKISWDVSGWLRCDISTYQMASLIRIKISLKFQSSSCNPHHTILTFNDPEKRSLLLKTLWEREKMLVTSIFSLSGNVFYPFQKEYSICFKSHLFYHLQILSIGPV